MQFPLQPNAGAQGEFAGLLAIQKFHENNSDTKRNVCIIPKSVLTVQIQLALKCVVWKFQNC